MRETFVSLASGDGKSLATQWIQLGGGKPRVGILAGYSNSRSLIGVKNLTVNLENPEKRKIHHTQGVIVLFDSDSGFPKAIIEGITVSYARTGADAAVASSLLSKREVRTVGIVGARDMATHFLNCLVLLYSQIESVKVYSKSRVSSDNFARKMNNSLNIEIDVCSHPREVAEMSDLIMTGTPSTTPIIMDDWIRPGTHLNWMGNRKEVDWNILSHSKVVTTIRDAGWITEAVSKGEIPKDPVYAGIGEIATHARKGRENDNEITVYSSVATGLLDLVLSSALYDEAIKRGIGKKVDLFDGAPAW